MTIYKRVKVRQDIALHSKPNLSEINLVVKIERERR